MAERGLHYPGLPPTHTARLQDFWHAVIMECVSVPRLEVLKDSVHVFFFRSLCSKTMLTQSTREHGPQPQNKQNALLYKANHSQPCKHYPI